MYIVSSISLRYTRVRFLAITVKRITSTNKPMLGIDWTGTLKSSTESLWSIVWQPDGRSNASVFFSPNLHLCAVIIVVELQIWCNLYSYQKSFFPRFRESVGTFNLIRLSVCPSVPRSVCHKHFNLGHNFCTITGRALILGMCVLCDKTFTMVPCSNLERDL